MVRTCVRAAAVALAVCCGLLLASAWRPAQAAPVVFQKASDNGAGDDAGRFTAVLDQGSSGDQAIVQLFTAAGPGSRITGLYVQDTTGAIARDGVSGGALVRLAPTQLHEVLLADPGGNKIAVIKALSDSLGIALGAAKDLVDRAPTVIRTASTPAGNAQLKQALESAGASVTLRSRQDPSVPAGANLGVALPGAAPTGYDVVLASVGANKVGIIKLVRDLTGLGLAEAKALVDAAPSVLLAHASPDEALAMRQALVGSGATVELTPADGTPGQGAIALPPGSTGIVPDIALGFVYDDPDATPTLQLTLDLDILFADLLDAWRDGRFLWGLRVTDGDGLSDLYLAVDDAAPAQVPEPPTVALMGLALLCLLGLVGRPERNNARCWRAAATA